jgi:hypothetical protein
MRREHRGLVIPAGVQDVKDLIAGLGTPATELSSATIGSIHAFGFQLFRHTQPGLSPLTDQSKNPANCLAGLYATGMKGLGCRWQAVTTRNAFGSISWNELPR